MDAVILKCDILEVLQNDDYTVLQKWVSSCREFRSRVAVKIDERLLLEANDTKKRFINTEKISELQQEIDTVKSNINSIVLEQKKVDKKVSDVVTSQENLKAESGEMKTQCEALEIEIMDLQIEIEQRREKKILQWEAVKRACKIYKMNLDIHMNVQEEKDCQNIKFSFFTYNSEQDIYFVELSYKQGHWKIEGTEPKVKTEHYSQLSSIIDFPEYSKVSDITLFLYQIRNIYLKYYMKTGKKV